jgi:beta-lactamase regulating signal transducer with metallopeptidase domain
MIDHMTSQLGVAALVGFVMSAFTWLWARLARSRSAEDRAALWAIGLTAVLVGSTATLFVKPLHLAIELPQTRLLAKHPSSSAVAEMDFGARGGLPSALGSGAPPASDWPSAMASRAAFLILIEEVAVDLWALVTAVLLARWALGYLRAFRLLRRSIELEPKMRARLEALPLGGVRPMLPAIRLSGAVAVPLTVSLVRSTILLPLDALRWGNERMLAVMAHELAHVGRQDGLARSMARLCTALHWFNPLVWLGAARLEEAQEIAADDAILDAGLRPSSCARELLAIAEALTLDRNALAAALPMVETGSLMARLALILGPARSHALSPRLIGGAALTFTALAVGMVSLRATVSFADTARERGTMPLARAADDGGFYETASAGVDGGSFPVPSDGSTLIADGQGRPGGIATDETHVYWTNFEGGSLMRAPLGGGSPTTLIAGQHGPQSLVVGSGQIYWTNFEDGTVMRMPLSEAEPALLASGQDHPSGVAIDSTNLYWVTNDGSVRSVPLAGGEPTTLSTGIESFPAAARSIAVDASYVYWTEGGDLSVSNGRIMRAPLAGGPALVLARDQDSPCRLAVDSESVFWTNLGTLANRLIDGTVMKVPREGGTPIVLASGQLQPLGIALDGGNLYWTRAPIEEVSQGIVMRMSLSGGKPTVAAWQQHRPSSIVASAGGVYWTNGGDGSVRTLSR